MSTTICRMEGMNLVAEKKWVLSASYDTFCHCHVETGWIFLDRHKPFLRIGGKPLRTDKPSKHALARLKYHLDNAALSTGHFLFQIRVLWFQSSSPVPGQPVLRLRDVGSTFSCGCKWVETFCRLITLFRVASCVSRISQELVIMWKTFRHLLRKHIYDTVLVMLKTNNHIEK